MKQGMVCQGPDSYPRVGVTVEKVRTQEGRLGQREVGPGRRGRPPPQVLRNSGRERRQSLELRANSPITPVPSSAVPK